MVRLTGGAAAEAVRVEVRDLVPALVETFDQDTREGTLLDPTGGSINFNEYEWGPDRERPDTFRFNVTDADQKFLDAIDEGFGVRAGFDNPLTDCIVSYDMETRNAAGEMLDLSLAGNNGVITGTADVAGMWGRARKYTADTDRIRVSSLTYDGFTAFGHCAIVRIGNANAGDTEQTIIGIGGASTNQQGTTVLLGPVAGLPDTIRVKINTSTTGFQNIDRAFTFVLGNIYDIFVTWDGTAVRIYVDGIQQGGATTQEGTLVTQTAGLAFTVGHHADAAIHNATINEKLDEVILYKNRAPTSVEVADIFKRRSRAPRYYFNGRIKNIKHDQGETTITAHGLLKNMTNYDVYDIIYEGASRADTVRPSFFYKQSNGYFGTDAEHTGDHMKFKEADETTKLNGTDRVYNEKIEFPLQSDWSPKSLSGGGPAFKPSYRVAIDDFEYWGVEFQATAKQIERVGVLVNYRGVVSGTQWRIMIVDDADKLVGDADATLVSDGSSTYQWRYATMAGGSFTYELNVGDKYFLVVQALDVNQWTPAAPFEWARNTFSSVFSRRRVKTPTTDVSTLFNQGPCVLFLMDGNWKELIPTEDYIVDAASVADILVAKVSSDTLIGTTINADFEDAEIMAEFFRCTYFYSQNTQKVSTVIDRILGKVGLTGIYTGAPGLGSSATSENLGLYIPQGGSVWEHITQLAALVEDRPRFTPPTEVRFERWPEPTLIRNLSFERVTTGTVLRDWKIVTPGDATAVRSSDQQFSGDFSVRMDFDSTDTTPFDTITKVYQDIEAFDPVVSNADTTNLSMKIRASVFANSNINVKLYDYGTFDNPVTIKNLPNAAPLNQWNDVTALIERSSFRLSIEIEWIATATPVDKLSFLFVDDVIVHRENQRFFYIKDASVNDGDFTSGFIPGTNEENENSVVHLLDDVEGPPDIQKEFARKAVNEAIVIGATQEGFGDPIIAIAKNPARQVAQGTLLKITNAESIKSVEDAYKKARKLLRNEALFRSKITLIGQYPFLFGRIINLVFPDHGMRDPTPVEVTSMRVGPSYTEIRINWSEVEEFEDVEKIKEREEFLAGAFDLKPNEQLIYFTTAVLSDGVTVSATNIFEARLKVVSEGGSGESVGRFLVQRDTRDAGEIPSVWTAIWNNSGDSDGGAVTGSSHPYDRLVILDNGSILRDTITLPETISGLPNMWIIVWLFAQ